MYRLRNTLRGAYFYQYVVTALTLRLFPSVSRLQTQLSWLGFSYRDRKRPSHPRRRWKCFIISHKFSNIWLVGSVVDFNKFLLCRPECDFPVLFSWGFLLQTWLVLAEPWSDCYHVFIFITIPSAGSLSVHKAQ